MKLAIVGASGAVGRMMIEILDELKVEVSTLSLFASKRSAGTIIIFRNQKLVIQELNQSSFDEGFDAVLFSAGSETAKEYAPIAKKFAEIIIDNSSAFRKEISIPLVVPEVNSYKLMNYKGIVANPNCSTIQMVLALNPINEINKIKKIVVSTYQAVSGAGQAGINELNEQRQGKFENKNFPEQIYDNVIPEIGNYLESGYTEEENKMQFETKKILDAHDLEITATTVRVPVNFGHSENIYLELENEVDIKAILNKWNESDSLIYHQGLLTPKIVVNSNNSHCSHLRIGGNSKSCVFWNVANNLRVGAATNAVRILKFWQNLNS